jgi:hypothetical protein
MRLVRVSNPLPAPKHSLGRVRFYGMTGVGPVGKKSKGWGGIRILLPPIMIPSQ